MSKHELDCPLSTIDSDVDAKDCVFCPIARAAYKRGREEVSQNILQLVSNSKYCELPFYDIDHDGSECCIRMKTIRKVLSGEWTIEDPTLNNDWHMKG